MLQLQKSVLPEVSKGEKDFCKKLYACAARAGAT